MSKDRLGMKDPKEIVNQSKKNTMNILLKS